MTCGMANRCSVRRTYVAGSRGVPLRGGAIQQRQRVHVQLQTRQVRKDRGRDRQLPTRQSRLVEMLTIRAAAGLQ